MEHDPIETALNDFDRALQRGEMPRLADYLNRAPPTAQGELCGLLVAQAMQTRSGLGDRPWIDTYVSEETWSYRGNVCRQVTQALYAVDGGALADRLGARAFGDYRAYEVIGFGGFGTVLRACHKDRPSEVVAVKVAHPTDRYSRSALDNEAGILQRLGKIEAVPRFIDHDEAEVGQGTPYLIMSHVEGQPLSRWMAADLAPSARLRVCRHLARIVQQLHDDGTSHGDLSPENILVADLAGSPSPRVIDFGTACRGFKRSRLPVISARYAAPELLKAAVGGPKEIANHRSDLWSLAVLLHEVLGKGHPFGELPAGATIEMMVERAAHAPASVSRDLPNDLRNALLECLRPNPEDRDQAGSAQQLHDAIPADGDWPTPDGGGGRDGDGWALRRVAVRDSYLCWLVEAHGRLEFRGIRHARGGAVSVELSQVYLALQADGTNPLERAAARQALRDEIAAAVLSGELTPEEAEYAHWYFIAGSPTMPSLESRDRRVLRDPKQKELLNLADAYFRESQLVVLGDPGSGKTTLARWLTSISARAALDGHAALTVPLYQVDPDVSDLSTETSLGRVRLPILVRIAEYAEERRRQIVAREVPSPLVEFLGRHTWNGSVAAWHGEGPARGRPVGHAALNRLFMDALRDGEALVVLDGLDEVPASALRDAVVEEVDAFARRWVGGGNPAAPHGPEFPADLLAARTADLPGNRLIVTSRIAGYHAVPLRGDLAHVTVEPMTPSAVARFVANWMRAVHRETASAGTPEATVTANSDAESARLLEALAGPRQRGGRELATNPLLCGLLATVFRSGAGSLPQERVELYRQAVDVLVGIYVRRAADDERSRLIRYELFDMLEPLAEHVHRHEPTGLIPEDQLRQLALRFLAESRGENPLRATPALRTAVDDLIRIVREDVGLLAARGEGVYGFLHLTFQEYLAARSLAKDPAAACTRLAEHLGDARWREPIRLALGHLSVERPEHFTVVAHQLLDHPSRLNDLLPQAAFTIVGALPDLRHLGEETTELLVVRLLNTYATQELRDRLPRRRGLVESAFRKLLSSDSRPAAEDCLARALEDGRRRPEPAAAAAELLRRLDHFTPRLLQALLRAAETDSAEWKWPAHAALRFALTPKPDAPAQRLEPPPATLPFRQALLDDPNLVTRIRQDLDWLQVVLCLYGGLGDCNASDTFADYHRAACFLQQEGQARARYRPAYGPKWGGDDGDFVYHIAVDLDAEGAKRLKYARTLPRFDPLQIHRDAAWTAELLATLRAERSPHELLPTWLAVARTPVPATGRTPRDGRRAREAKLLLWVLGQGARSHQNDPQELDEELSRELSRVRADLSDAVARSGPAIVSRAKSMPPELNPSEWWAIFEAASATALTHGSEPLLSDRELLASAPAQLRPLVIAEELALYGKGWGDDSVYRSAKFADDTKITPEELVAAFGVLPVAAHHAWKVFHFNWPAAAFASLAWRYDQKLWTVKSQ